MVRFEFVENETTQVTEEQLESLRDLISISDHMRRELGLRSNPMQVTGESIRFNGVSARVTFNDIELIVRPKIMKEKDSAKSEDSYLRDLYLKIIKTCRGNLNSVVYFTSMATESILDENFVDCIAQYYYEKLYYAIKKLPIVVYYQKEEKRSTIKGKVLIQKELRSPIRDGKTWCRYKVLSQDNLYNALLKWCCGYFADKVSSRTLKSKLLKVYAELEGNEEELTASLVRSSRLPRNFDAYKEPYRIARDIYLYSKQTKKLKNSKDFCGYFINMETAFENIVCYYTEQLSTKKKLLHIPQADRLLAVSDNDPGVQDFHVRPDDLLVKDDSSLIIDAKYKYLAESDKPSREDFYQMIASCIAYKTNEAILIYPQNKESDIYNMSWSVDNPLDGNRYSISANKINIFDSEQKIIEQIWDSIKESHFSEVIGE